MALKESTNTNCCNPIALKSQLKKQLISTGLTKLDSVNPVQLNAVKPIIPPKPRLEFLPRGEMRPPATVYSLPIRNRIKHAYVVRLNQQSDV